MREYTSKVDKLEEAETLRQTEEKEAEYKPVAMGESPDMSTVSPLVPSCAFSLHQSPCSPWSGCRLAEGVSQPSQPDDT